MNPNVNFGLWVIKMHQSRSISCNKCTTWWGMLTMGEAVHEWGYGVYGKSLYLPHNFAVNLKRLWKNSLKKICVHTTSAPGRADKHHVLRWTGGSFRAASRQVAELRGPTPPLSARLGVWYGKSWGGSCKYPWLLCVRKKQPWAPSLYTLGADPNFPYEASTQTKCCIFLG